MNHTDALTTHKKRLTAVYIVVLSSSLLISSIMVSKGDDPSAEAEGVSGNQIFPPANLTNESSMQDLGAWLNQILDLNITGIPMKVEEPFGVTFLDAFNMTVKIPAYNWKLRSASGTVLNLLYSKMTNEFISFDVRFKPSRIMETTDLRNYTISIANSLGIPLINSSYVEYNVSYLGPGSNGTEQTEIIHKVGFWREMHESLPVHVANQMRIWEDVESHSAISLKVFRWYESLPQVNYTLNEIIHEASEIQNMSFGSRLYSNYKVGIFPNYQNLTWSFIVRLTYPGHDCGSEMNFLMLEMETLEFQGFNDRVIAICSGGILTMPFLPIFFLLFGGIFFTSTILAWRGRSNSMWATTIVAFLLPLYVRLKRESVLDHFLRGRIVEFVSINPGATFSQIQDKFDMANGVLNYHLWILARTGFLRPVKEGKFSRYYPEGSTNRASMILSSFQYTMLRIIFLAESISLQRLAQDMESSKQRVHYNVRRLEKFGFIEKDKRGGVHVVSLSQKGLAVVKEATENKIPGKSARRQTS